jgi:4-hydroxy-3-methylbut-2-enyl diphosphate reductase
MRSFDVPEYYRADEITTIKRRRNAADPKKRDFSPTEIQRQGVTFLLARHFGFCYGVENAVDTAYRAVSENQGRKVFLISEMIHNPRVNSDLARLGVRFLRDTAGKELIPLSEIRPDDVVIIPAFGAATEVLAAIGSAGAQIKYYDATCPFVQRVWKRASELGAQGYSLVIHGKRDHEETRATFSRAAACAPTLVIKDIKEADLLAGYIRGDGGDFVKDFAGRYSEGFDFKKHLIKVGTINQTTMLAGETLEIMELIKAAIFARDGEGSANFANTKDTLCYATWDNQQAVHELAGTEADLALVVGGYNSSNTSHLAEILAEKLRTFYVKDSSELISVDEVRGLNINGNSVEISRGWLPTKRPLRILLTSGASCPDAALVEVMDRVEALLR